VPYRAFLNIFSWYLDVAQGLPWELKSITRRCMYPGVKKAKAQQKPVAKSVSLTMVFWENNCERVNKPLTLLAFIGASDRT
jgi:hypothetical protein